MAPVYPSTRNRPEPYYRFRVGNYLVFYVVDGDTVEVRRLLYRARNIESLLRLPDMRELAFPVLARS